MYFVNRKIKAECLRTQLRLAEFPAKNEKHNVFHVYCIQQPENCSETRSVQFGIS